MFSKRQIHTVGQQTTKREATRAMDQALQITSKTLIQVGEVLGIRNIDPDPGRILITGGTGPVGHRVALSLLKDGYQAVRLGARHPEDANFTDLNALGAELVHFAWDRTDTYKLALSGVKSLLCTIPYQQDWDQYFPIFLKACHDAGVKHFVKLSFYHSMSEGDVFQEIPLVQAHGRCDRLLVNSVAPLCTTSLSGDGSDVGVDLTHPNFSYTLLCGSHYMSNPLIYQGKELRHGPTPGTFYGACGNHGVNYISPNDVADVAVHVLLSPRRHYNKQYTLTGPEPIPNHQVADLLSKHLHRPIMYVDQPLHEFIREHKFGGDAAWVVRDLAAMENVKATGVEEKDSFATDDVATILGRKPESFREYLDRHETMTKAELP